MTDIIGNLKHDEYYAKLQNCSYNDMLELAEYDVSAYADMNHCDVMLSALENVLKHGTCGDAAHAIKHFANYTLAMNELIEAK